LIQGPVLVIEINQILLALNSLQIANDLSSIHRFLS